MSPSGSLAGRKRERFAHSATDGKGSRVHQSVERLALAHAACSELARTEAPYPVALTELAHKLASTFSAQAVAIHEGFVGGETATSLDGEAGSALRELCTRYLGAPPPARVIVLSQPEDGAPLPAMPGLDTAIVVPLVLPRGEAVLALGWAGATPPATEDLICSRILGDHLALAMAAASSGLASSNALTQSPTASSEGTSSPGASSQETSADGARTSPIDDFVSMTAHELRTPLTPITMLLQSLERKAKNGAVDLEAIQRTRKQVQRLTVMISDLLDISRLHEDRLVLAPELFDLGDVLSEEVQNHQHSEPKHQLAFVPPTGSFPVMGDRPRIARSIASLLEHVIRLTPGDEVVRIDLGEAQGQAVLTLVSKRLPLPPDASLPLAHGGALPPRKSYPVSLAVRLAEALTVRHGGKVTISDVRGTETRAVATFPLALAASSEVSSPAPK